MQCGADRWIERLTQYLGPSAWCAESFRCLRQLNFLKMIVSGELQRIVLYCLCLNIWASWEFRWCNYPNLPGYQVLL